MYRWKNYIGQLNECHHPSRVPLEEDNDEKRFMILRSESNQALKDIRNKKGVGIDDIPIDFIKNMEENRQGILYSNPRGSRNQTRRLYAGVALSIVLYGAPAWATELAALKPSIRLTEMVRKKISARLSWRYRTVSGTVAGILAGIPPVDLLATNYQTIYEESRRIRQEGGVITASV